MNEEKFVSDLKWVIWKKLQNIFKNGFGENEVVIILWHDQESHSH